MSDPRALAADLRHLLAALVRAALLGDDPAGAAARSDALRQHAALRAVADPASLEALELNGLWTQAVEEAETADLVRRPHRVSLQFPAMCPLSLGDLIGPGLALTELETRIRDSAATG